ncbi:ABC transporter permease [Lacticaseibacillus zhaodongensis]|uniref:ABC transporter permease n=1 Tax=Lacticaseibacillus zhaodongensis TaxID=2668065 RepID=UPI0012D2EC63|nr:ABC transporter permease [Lacticaseibacillus zhaodongensis]
MLFRVITKDFKTNVWSMSTVALLLACLILILFNLAPSSLAQAAMPGELFVPLIAIICLPTVFLPDQAESIQAVINSKHYRLPLVRFLRVSWFLLLLSMLDAGIIIVYGLHGVAVPLLALLVDFIGKVLLLAGIIVTIYRITQNIVVAYIVPVTYFALCLGYTGLGPFNLLTAMHGRSLLDCWWQIFVALLLLVTGLLPFRQARTYLD